MSVRRTTLPDKTFWRGKRVLLTGHTGFKGTWLAWWLRRLGAQVTGMALPPATQPSLHEGLGPQLTDESLLVDLRNAESVCQAVHQMQPEIVLHLAAQALVRRSYADPLETWGSNVMGTAHLLDALRICSAVRVVVVVTTDKVYANQEWIYPYREDDRLGGHDPYSASKAATELLVASYRAAFLKTQGVAVATARAGNVIGGGDWAADRLIPDAVRAWRGGVALSLRYPGATRPWQHVLEPLNAYLVLAERLWSDPDLAQAYNFGPVPHQSRSVRDVIELALSAYGTGSASYENDSNQMHETQSLALETALGHRVLGVGPVWSVEQAVAHTMRWYRAYDEGVQPHMLCQQDLDRFVADATRDGPHD